jgi:3-hydroxyisobutyrate dehydrogenase-like beta-hydroxyacid dehydrogenase/glyoxylase-like metal-dependent hydrolase (beta-lactamase superfamily II)
MEIIPLEDNVEDIVGKAMRGWGISNSALAAAAHIPLGKLGDLRAGMFDAGTARAIAPHLHLDADALVALGEGAWRPHPVQVPGLWQFRNAGRGMQPNSYLIYHAPSLTAVAFDTGEDAQQMLETLAALGVGLAALCITHTHGDHIACLKSIRHRHPEAAVHVGSGEPLPGAVLVEDGQVLTIGGLRILCRLTSGHSVGGITYVVEGLARPAAVVGDALFAGSMGGGMVSWQDALENNRKAIYSLDGHTVLCPGHGPMTTVEEEKHHNPFCPEFKHQSTINPNTNNPTTMSDRIAFVGVGRMGANMARRLKEVGRNVTAVYDVNRQAAAEVAGEIGAKACEKLADVTAAADIIFTVVTNDAAMRHIFLNPADNLLTGAKGRTFINCATLSPGMHVEVEKAAEAAGASSIEGCMASSIPQARQGTLQLMIGGKKEHFDRVEPLLKQMSAVLTYVGPTGKAAEVKALVNMVMNINTAALAEGLGLGAALGLDLNMLSEVFKVTGANSRVLATDGEDMINREHSCFFSSEHAAKDSNIALALAKAKGLVLPLASATAEQFERLVAAGLGELDKSGVAELTFPGRHAHPKVAAG